MGSDMTRRTLVFTAPRQVTLRDTPVPEPGEGQLLVAAHLSAISAGTEMLIYRGQAPVDLPADATIPALSGSLAFPLPYGYSWVGEVVGLGKGVQDGWLGRRAFAFHPHESHFTSRPEELTLLPDSLPDDDAAFIPTLETAIGLVHDGRPLAGERVVVIGQGIVGLLTTSLLARFPLESLVTFDRFPLRRQASLDSGASLCLDPAAGIPSDLRPASEVSGADLVFELSGSPEGLDLAIALTGFSGRIVIGSWYGTKPVSLDLGGRFHRSRIRLIASQVSTIDPTLSGRWTKQRRLGFALNLLADIRPSRFITQRFSIIEADRAYRLLDERPETAIQVVLDYPVGPSSEGGRARAIKASTGARP
jgi:2-desacetyl-2-hydroxyethyl bacteriochlorophyllide A dehydrogenase